MSVILAFSFRSLRCLGKRARVDVKEKGDFLAITAFNIVRAIVLFLVRAIAL
ncbi:MAG: hypothetical protein ACRC62_05800 [Microcoleus sp.]